MRGFKPAELDTVATFGQRKITPRVCIVDAKRHIRTFLAEALEELGFVASECASADRVALAAGPARARSRSSRNTE